MPVAILVNKVGGLYERDELVLKKTTLDEAPTLLQITGLFALIVFLGQNVFVHAGMTPPLVAELWLASFFARCSLAGWPRAAGRHASPQPERCLVLGDAEAIRTVQVQARERRRQRQGRRQRPARPARPARRAPTLPRARRATTTCTA